MRTGERGLTLIEILLALAIFAIIVVGALGAVGAASTGLTDAFPTAFGTGRAAKDYTVASTYLQGFEEYMSDYVSAATVGTIEAGSPYTFDPTAADILGFPLPSAQPYQLNWTQLEVIVDRWYWDCAATQYSATAPVTNDQVIRVWARLTWSFKDTVRSVPVERFVPYRPDIGLTVTPCP